ncbi:MAG: tetratricopeptide repeat protein [Planctomycetota bacterium]
MKKNLSIVGVILAVLAGVIVAYVLLPGSEPQREKPKPTGPLPMTPEIRRIVDTYMKEARKNYDAGHLDEAIRNGEMALKFLRDRGQDREAAERLIELARWYFQQGDVDRGASYLLATHFQGLDREGAAWKKVSDDALEELRYLAFGLSEAKREAEAVRALERFLAEYRKRGNRPMEAQMLHNMGWVLADNGHHERALELYERALKIRRAQRLTSGVIWTLNNMGYSRYRMKDLEKAKDILLEAFELAGEEFHEAWIKVLDNLILVIEEAQASKKFDLAVGVGEKILKAVKTRGVWYIKDRVLITHAKALRAAGRMDEARGIFRDLMRGSEEEGYDYGVAIYQFELGKTFAREGDLDRALERFGRARAIQERIGDFLGMGWTDDAAGRALSDAGRKKEAVERFRGALTSFEAAEDHRDGLLAVLPAYASALEALGEAPQAAAARMLAETVEAKAPPGVLEKKMFMEQIERRGPLMAGMKPEDTLVRIMRVKGGWRFTDVPTGLELHVSLRYRKQPVTFQGVDFFVEGSLFALLGYWVYFAEGDEARITLGGKIYRRK